MIFARNKFEKISYSQCGEDMIVKHLFDQMGNFKPSYLDIGAHHPFYLSNTACFYKNGSSGINIEPDPALFQNFIKHRKRDKNLNIGVSDMEGELDFYVISDSTLNTFSKAEAENYLGMGNYGIKEVKKIKVDTLRNVINKHSAGKFPDFLSVDAEGIDEIIVKEVDFATNYPVVICIETVSFSTTGKGKKNQALIEFISSRGYIAYADTNVNTIFVRRDKWER